jgi:oligosaccharyltransferase complex subunit alpha (ribophorin I)
LFTTYSKMRLLHLATVAGVLLGCVADSNLTKSANSQQILQGDFRPPQVFQNVNLVRNTNLDKGYVRETINVVVENVDKQPQSDYFLPFEYGVMSKIGGIEIRDKKNPEKGKFRVETAGVPAVLAEDGTSST